MRKFLFGLLLLGIIRHNAFSQANIYPGYYLNNQGEQVQVVFYLPADSLPYKHFIIYNEKDRSYTELRPSEAREVMVNEKGKYVSKEITGPDSTKYLVFIEVLVKGSASLYYYPLQPDLFLFIETPEVGLLPISNYKSILTIDDIKYKRIRPYANKVVYILKDCPEIKQRISSTEYAISSFTRLVDTYNKCVGGKSEYVRKPEVRKLVDIGPVLFWGGSGFNLTGVHFDRYEAIGPIKFVSLVNFGIGGYIELKPPKSNYRNSFRLYTYYQKSTYHSVNDPIYYYGLTNDYLYSDFKLSVSDIFINLLLTRYFPLSNKQKINLEGGVFFALPINISGSRIQYTETYPNLSPQNHDEYFDHYSSLGIMTGLHYIDALSKTRSVSVFGQGGMGTFSVTWLGYYFTFGIKADLF